MLYQATAASNPPLSPGSALSVRAGCRLFAVTRQSSISACICIYSLRASAQSCIVDDRRGRHWWPGLAQIGVSLLDGRPSRAPSATQAAVLRHLAARGMIQPHWGTRRVVVSIVVGKPTPSESQAGCSLSPPLSALGCCLASLRHSCQPSSSAGPRIESSLDWRAICRQPPSKLARAACECRGAHGQVFAQSGGRAARVLQPQETEAGSASDKQAWQIAFAGCATISAAERPATSHGTKWSQIVSTPRKDAWTRRSGSEIELSIVSGAASAEDPKTRSGSDTVG